MSTDAFPSRPLDRLLAIMARLRDPACGCPWDIEQTFRTIAPHTIEEAYEVADAIEREDMTELRDELGDLLFQVVFHARLAEERGAFDFEGVAEAIAGKMIRRHPHVFGEAQVANAAAQTARWEDHKAAERAADAAAAGRAPSALDGVIGGLPGLTRAMKLQSKASTVGFDWNDARLVLDKIREETAEIEQALDAGADKATIAAEIGDLLFAVVNLARHVDADPEAAVRSTNAKFERRFAHIETALVAAGKTPTQASLDEMEALWNEAKTLESKPSP